MTSILWHLPSLLTHEAFHFALQSIAALLAVSLIWIISSLARRRWPGNAWQTTRRKYFILSLALCCGLLAAWVSHTQLDRFTVWYTTPLGEHMTIIRGNEVWK